MVSKALPIVQPLAKVVHSIRDYRGRDDDPREPSKVWTEEDSTLGTPEPALVVILRTRGCSWAMHSGCTMCGYPDDSFIRKVDDGDLVEQFSRALARAYKDQRIVKLYTSGSFLDKTEVPLAAQRAILASVPGAVKKVTVETQAEYVTEETLGNALAALKPGCRLELAFGVESTDPTVLMYSVNKTNTLEDFARAARLARGKGVGAKAYVLVKPPFLSERDAIEDAVRSADDVEPHSDVVSFNPVNIQNRTLVERLWQRGEYRAPWLWSVVEILKRTHGVLQHKGKSDPVGAGAQRGAHNCGTCDKAVYAAIKTYDATHDVSMLDRVPECACREEWRDLLELEPLTLSTTPL
ncbi:MAG: archaeosine biosynthesis radical SAM protein RaSEA [Methanobacteriota archaeon]